MGPTQKRPVIERRASSEKNLVSSGKSVGYMMSRFPKITETFVLNEIVELEKMGFDVSVFPLLREREAVTHSEADRITEKAFFSPFLNGAIIWANVKCFFRSPARFVSAWGNALRTNLGSLNFTLGGLGVLPKCAWIAEKARELEVEHIHAHFGNHPALAAMTVSRLSDIPFSFTAHGSDIHIDQTGLERKVRESEFAVMISDYNRQFVLERIEEDLDSKLRIVRCGVDLRNFRPEAALTSSSKPKFFEILCVASFRDVKGHRHLIDAGQKLSQRGIEFQCHLIGSGPMEAKIRAQIESYGLEDRFLFHGPRPQAYVHEQMLRSDVVALTSVFGKRGNREGIPVTLMEAMACGRPVVASRISGIPELVEDGVDGLLAEPGNPQELADAFEALAKDSALGERLGRAARQKIEAEYNLRKNTVKLAKLF